MNCTTTNCERNACTGATQCVVCLYAHKSARIRARARRPGIDPRCTHCGDRVPLRRRVCDECKVAPKKKRTVADTLRAQLAVVTKERDAARNEVVLLRKRHTKIIRLLTTQEPKQ